MRPSKSLALGSGFPEGLFIVAASTRISFRYTHGSCGRRPTFDCREEARVITETRDHEEIIERVAALDIGKAELMCCVRVRDDERRGKRCRRCRRIPR